MGKVDPPTRRRKCKEQWKVVFRWWGRSLVYSWRRDETVLNSFRAILRSTKRIIRRSVRCACLYYTNRSGISFVYISISTRNDARHGTKFDVDGSVFEHRAYFVSGEFLFIDCKKQPSSFAFTFNQLQSDCSRIFWFRIFTIIFTRSYPRILLSMHRNSLFVLSEKKYEFLRIHETRARGEKLGIETCVIQNW